MDLDDTPLKTTRCLSVLVAGAATGAPTVTAVTWPVLRKYFCVPQFGTGYELNIKQVTCALLALWEVHRYVRICLAPTQSGAVGRKSIGAVGRAELHVPLWRLRGHVRSSHNRAIWQTT